MHCAGLQIVGISDRVTRIRKEMRLEPSVPIRAHVCEGNGQVSVAIPFPGAPERDLSRQWATGEHDGGQLQERAVFTPAASNPAVRW